MPALAKDTTLLSILEGLTGAEPARTAKVSTISFDETQFESGRIDTSTGENISGSGYYRTIGYVALPSNPWMGQIFTDKPWNVFILYYDANKVYQDYDQTYTGFCNLKNYPFCRLYFLEYTSYLSTVDYIKDCLKIQYITSAPAENEYFLSNCLFNGNFQYDRNSDGVGDGWVLKNSPVSSSVDDNIQTVTPSQQNYFIQMDMDGRLLGHVIYVSYTAYAPYAGCMLSVFGSNVIIAKNNKFTRVSQLITGSVSGTSPRITLSSSDGVNHPIYLKNIMMIDLTERYGSGNEPSALQIDELIDTWYDGYVPCSYTIIYDDSNIPVDVLSRLKSIDDATTGTDEVVMTDGAVSDVKHYVAGVLQSTTTINRDMFGNIVSIEEV